MLLLAGDAAEAECVGMLFEFLHSLITLQVPGLSRLYPRFVAMAMQWIRTELACAQSLSLICSIAVDVRRSDGDVSTVEVQQNVMAQLDQSLSVSSE